MEKSRIRSIRRQKDISGTKVAEMLGISAQYYYDIEKGKRNLSAEMAARLAEIFGVTTDYLLGRTDEPNEKSDWDSKLPELTKKDEKDIAKDLQRIMDSLESQEGLMYDGEPMDEETKELIKISLENSMRLAKRIAKKKFTPKKYRK
ncbi:helix-turn-helix transcriptional regulator [Aneurinibacillus thermoaerophilus]|uniref:DNA-binding transcriptional regulator, XRE-family HTH domain n=1 Tax=Aneurinibacillus thermoaerophilus TaxID=143495 RepID=A0A1G8AR30_ANETH|nr:helix-turn-helix transcriptional regulator [Aneurinibacillus thermoaerophilus]MED0758750.1 helix-turn-helix transcriptional regulator [Aneurinibacillus thermoaerophilus]MED0760588.1 helix-turn-helix transcriptional regulator [Aneurinibacillus thermoaerophilus]SDH22730.1 DNA-binding transcriptional regulator, XRE-family HTH domain [Aneurinibacillus thermoaerophilus]